MRSSRSKPESRSLPRHETLGGQHHAPDFKSKSKSQAQSLALQFLNAVFAGDNASRFYSNLLTRFTSSSNKSPDGSYTQGLAPAL